MDPLRRSVGLPVSFPLTTPKSAEVKLPEAPAVGQCALPSEAGVIHLPPPAPLKLHPPSTHLPFVRPLHLEAEPASEPAAATKKFSQKGTLSAEDPAARRWLEQGVPFGEALAERFGIPSEGTLNGFLTRKDGEVVFGGVANLNHLAREHGSPLEVVVLPQITRNVEAMQGAADAAREKTGYPGRFLYAYATKSNYEADVVRTALEARTHYETSSTVDIGIATRLFTEGKLPPDRLIVAHGSKDSNYLEALIRFRSKGADNIVAVIDDLRELDTLLASGQTFKLGIREREAALESGSLGNDRFGLSAQRIDEMLEKLDQARREGKPPQDIVLYHAMVGRQITDPREYAELLKPSLHRYAELRKKTPSMTIFNIGGGMGTDAFSFDFHFDKEEFFRLLMNEAMETCLEHGVPPPDLMGELGRYTVANHVAHLLRVGEVKEGSAKNPADWYLLDGSLLVTAPNMMLLGKDLMLLPVDGWERPMAPVRFGSRDTCDSLDIYPAANKPPMLAPQVSEEGLTTALFGTGAYSPIIKGIGGAHHCLSREAKRIVFEEKDGQLVQRERGAQESATIERRLGYVPPAQGTRSRLA